MKKVFCAADSRDSVLHIVWGSRTPLPYTCVWIYGWYKENLQQESFRRSVLFQKYKPHLALLSSSLLLRPSISLSLKTAMEVWSLVYQRCCLLLLLLLHSLCFQPLPRPSTAFLYTFHAYFLSFSLSSLENHPFLFPCSLCAARQPCNCRPCEERGWALC